MKNLREYLEVRESLVGFLQQDVGTGDVTSESVLSPDLSARAQIICKSGKSTTIAGLEEAGILFDICKCRVQTLVRDGSRVERGTIVMNIYGRALAILRAERTALNLIMRMSGIATETRKLVEMVEKINRSIRVACTRKTAPGLRSFDKKAVSLGGGVTHRTKLDDMVLIKDNHLVLTDSIEQSISRAREKINGCLLLECEVKNLAEMVSAVRAGSDIVMLDNFSPRQAKAAITQIRKMGVRKKVKVEISGRIDAHNIANYAKLQPDIISLGYLTHSPKAIDYSLEIMSGSDCQSS
ncbi:MAG TPA: carboxylating nicotinate-nucleotide diphosphorylase [Candidatus Nitrosopolaris sp.]|nr:carboxylating nicotinate-nucleotide diphosphorylase [Candidatus Nitrosopolaris sp.]